MEEWATVFQRIADPATREQVLEATSKATEIPVEVLDQYLLTEEDGYRPPNGAINAVTTSTAPRTATPLESTPGHSAAACRPAACPRTS